MVPVDRLRSYDVREAIDRLFDIGSVLELRRDFGIGMITALARVEGRPVGVIANNPAHLAGAIDSDGADKAARFMQLCDAHGLADRHARRHAGDDGRPRCRGDRAGPALQPAVRHRRATCRVPMVSIVLRKSYGLGAQAMMGGSTKAPLACVAWPTGEFGGMGLEGAVRLGYRKELDACTDDADAREALFDELVDVLYEHGKALSIAEYFEIDDVIDPADTRRWITTCWSRPAAATGVRVGRTSTPGDAGRTSGRRRRAGSVTTETWRPEPRCRTPSVVRFAVRRAWDTPDGRWSCASVRRDARHRVSVTGQVPSNWSNT